MKLKDFCELRSGYQGKTYEGEAYKLIKLKDVTKDGVISYQDLERFDTDKIADKYILKKNEIIFKAKSSDNTAALVEMDIDKVVATAHFIVISIKEEYIDKVNPMYLTMFINSEYAQEYFDKHSEGSVLSIIKLSSLENLDVIVPSLSEQNKLSEIYSLMVEERITMKELMLEREKQVKAKFRSIVEREVL